LYRLTKARERKARDLDQVKCIKDEEGNVLVEETSIKQRWQTYVHKLLIKKGTETLCWVNWRTLKDFRTLGHVGVLGLKRLNVLLEGCAGKSDKT